MESLAVCLAAGIAGGLVSGLVICAFLYGILIFPYNGR